MSKVILEEQATPSTPATDRVAVYPKAGGQLYKKSDDGSEKQIIDASDEAAADDTTKGIATFEADDFDSSSGKIDLADSVAKSMATDGSAATPSGHEVTIAGGEGIDTSGAGSTVTITGEDASTTNKGILEIATDAEAKAATETDKAIVPSNLDDVLQNIGAVAGDDLDFNGEYAVRLQNSIDIAAKGASFGFNELSDKITVAANAKIEDIFSGGGSVHALVYIRSEGQGTGGAIIAMTARYQISTVSESGGKVAIKFTRWFSGDNGTWETGVIVPINTWTDIVFTYDEDSTSNNPIIYINGKPVTASRSAPTGTADTDSGVDLGIGNTDAGTRTFDGEIAIIQPYNKILTATEVKALPSGVPFEYIKASQTQVLTNYDFSSTWTGHVPDDWSITGTEDANSYLVDDDANNRVQIYTDNGDNIGIIQTPLTIGKRYQVIVDVETFTSGTLEIYNHSDAVNFDVTSPGITVGEFTALATTLQAHRKAGGNVDCILNSISVIRLGCVLQLEQPGIGHNQWLPTYGDMLPEVDGAIPINLPPNHIEKYRHTTAMTNDTTWADVTPPGYELEKIIFVNSTGNEATLDLGTTSGDSDVFKNQVIAANAITTIVINKMFSTSVTQTLYLNDDDGGSDWNSASLVATVICRRIEI